VECNVAFLFYKNDVDVFGFFNWASSVWVLPRRIFVQTCFAVFTKMLVEAKPQTLILCQRHKLRVGQADAFLTGKVKMFHPITFNDTWQLIIVFAVI